MSDPKWTPGPWRACGEGKCSCGQIWSVPHDHPVAIGERSTWGDRWFEAVAKDDGTLGVEEQFSAYGSFPEDQRVANIRLIAASPDLYDAVVTLLRFVDAMEASTISAAEFNAVPGLPRDAELDAARLALRKARGESA